MINKSKNEFGGRHFTADVILWAVRWYLQFPISYRDFERMLADRGVFVDHTSVIRASAVQTWREVVAAA